LLERFLALVILYECEGCFATVVVDGEPDVLAAQALLKSLSKIDCLAVRAFYGHLERYVAMPSNMQNHIERRFVGGIVIIERIGDKLYAAIKLGFFFFGIFEAHGDRSFQFGERVRPRRRGIC